ncbi:hypothetical protein EYF80_063199 [Liparis tanakae]|uniref:Uncharacterized protein n=1 Tax=Liparis tanakae TaxID=230148 RepID=A0A4Z2ED54_9TELE|nr:hypothetical protein EYF80_063199 [Liparis tanakae]
MNMDLLCYQTLSVLAVGAERWKTFSVGLRLAGRHLLRMRRVNSVPYGGVANRPQQQLSASSLKERTSSDRYPSSRYAEIMKDPPGQSPSTSRDSIVSSPEPERPFDEGR